jgi:fatty-acyl-CoA synthase
MTLLDKLRSDWTYVTGYLRLIAATKSFTPESAWTLADQIEAQVDRHAGRTFISFGSADITYAAFDARACRFAHWALKLGLRKGDTVALFMDNRPDYIAAWAGLAKIGVRSALINYNLTGPSLAHCIAIANARAVVFCAELASALDSAGEAAAPELGCWGLGLQAGDPRQLDRELEEMPERRPDRSLRQALRGADTALFIYTSGTTGLPKAAKITHLRAHGLMKVFETAVGVTPDDRIFLTLPLYHATGGMCGVGCAINAGAALILRSRFSASTFWSDAIETRATMLVYIGELGRYLMNQPPSALERSHGIVKGFGNGLRADVWREFVARTGIRRLVEFYGSTEGNVSYFNLDGRTGAVGRAPPLLRSRIKSRIVRFDVETEAPVRGADGLCIEAGVDEPGEAIGPISEEGRQRFDGYHDENQTRKKILRDVFEKGDAWFRTGDLLKRDREGYIYFVDRIGDTFRWKSENVSTGEVEAALGSLAGIAHAVVYGVTVPGYDGRAGMAALTLSQEVDFKALAARLRERLPAYAWPVFLRIREEAETTGTLKYRKVDLVADGFDPVKTSDPLYLLDADAGDYQPLGEDLCQDILSGRRRL